MPSSESFLNVKPKCKTEDKAKATESICNYIRSIYFVIKKWSKSDLGIRQNEGSKDQCKKGSVGSKIKEKIDTECLETDK